MPYSKITSSDIANWDSIDEIADSLEKRGLERVEGVSDHEDEIVLAIDDDEFVAVVKADEGKKAPDYRTRMDSARHTQVVSTEDFENFTFTSRRRSWDKHGRIQYQKFAFSKEQFQGRGEKVDSRETEQYRIRRPKNYRPDLRNTESRQEVL